MRVAAYLCATTAVLSAAQTPIARPSDSPSYPATPTTDPGASARFPQPVPANPALPTLWLIGDSTVRNGHGDGAGGQWGWGDELARYLDQTKINVVNRAIGGRSSRTYLTEGHWDEVVGMLKTGDVVVMQFGHNDSGPLDDTSRARGSLPGIGDETSTIFNPIMKKQEVVHSFGWYMRRYIDDTEAKSTTPIVCSLVPRKIWANGKIVRNKDTYAGWAEEVAQHTGISFVDLNELVAEHYDSIGEEAVDLLFADPHTHTTLQGAELNARIFLAAAKALKPDPLEPYLSDAGKLVPAEAPRSATTEAKAQASPPLAGIAHVALRVTDLRRAIDFYSRLGIHQAFYFGEPDKMTQVFLKINDTQFLELYPAKSGEPPGFMHLCFISANLRALYGFYVQNGLKPTELKQARAGNLLFTVEGPEKQNIEYTQYQPGSLHSLDLGKHLDPDSVVEGIAAVSLPMTDPVAARSFYLERLGFHSTAATATGTLYLPGRSGQRLMITAVSEASRALTILRVSNVDRVAERLRGRGLDVKVSAGSVTVIDPDGNLLVLEDRGPTDHKTIKSHSKREN